MMSSRKRRRTGDNIMMSANDIMFSVILLMLILAAPQAEKATKQSGYRLVEIELPPVEQSITQNDLEDGAWLRLTPHGLLCRLEPGRSAPQSRRWDEMRAVVGSIAQSKPVFLAVDRELDDQERLTKVMQALSGSGDRRVYIINSEQFNAFDGEAYSSSSQSVFSAHPW